jgi:hypothetical protein
MEGGWEEVKGRVDMMVRGVKEIERRRGGKETQKRESVAVDDVVTSSIPVTHSG